LKSYEKELNNYWKIKGIVNNMFRPQKTPKITKRKLYNTWKKNNKMHTFYINVLIQL